MRNGAAESRTIGALVAPAAFIRPHASAAVRSSECSPGRQRGLVVNPIDRFILKARREQGLVPAAEASRPPTLIRRVTFDLTGLPPTPEEVDAFVADDRPDAYERLVDRLLASPGYGQRWARHWLDLVRYAESDGYRQDAYRPDAWRYRDYVVRPSTPTSPTTGS